MQSAARLATNKLNASKPDAPAYLSDRSGLRFAGSQGAKTPEGKAKSAQNATKFGLYSTAIVVHPEEKEEFETLTADLQSEFAPATATEQTFAARALNAAWRLRRCDRIEANLTAIAHENGLDPLEDSQTAATLNSIDRARTQAITTHRRSIAELRRLQTNRHLRGELFPEGAAPPDLGLADHKTVLSALRHSGDRSQSPSPAPILKDFQDLIDQIDKTNPTPAGPPAAPFIAEFTKRTQQLPRNAPCPWRSGWKFKRCCGRNAPATLGRTA